VAGVGPRLNCFFPVSDKIQGVVNGEGLQGVRGAERTGRVEYVAHARLLTRAAGGVAAGAVAPLGDLGTSVGASLTSSALARWSMSRANRLSAASNSTVLLMARPVARWCWPEFTPGGPDPRGESQSGQPVNSS
jgi:hypothetical protein